MAVPQPALLDLIFFYLIFCGLASSLAGPWAWTCDASRKACDKVVRDSIATPMDLFECKMTCSDNGLLWPLPKHVRHLSKTLTLVQKVDDFVLESLNMDTQSQSLLQEFFDDGFKDYLRKMLKDPKVRCRRAWLVSDNSFLTVQ